jgi:hypothetical protein
LSLKISLNAAQIAQPSVQPRPQGTITTINM